MDEKYIDIGKKFLELHKDDYPKNPRFFIKEYYPGDNVYFIFLDDEVASRTYTLKELEFEIFSKKYIVHMWGEDSQAFTIMSELAEKCNVREFKVKFSLNFVYVDCILPLRAKNIAKEICDDIGLYFSTKLFEEKNVLLERDI